jgi:hypothetical protein
MNPEKLNRIVVSVFAPLLILTGIAGFVVPEQYRLTSDATPYNLFHILFGAIGLFLVSTNKPRWPILFNIGFGLLDLYQALASVMSLWPERAFRWTYTDDILHVILGFALVLIGLYGLGVLNPRQQNQ